MAMKKILFAGFEQLTSNYTTLRNHIAALCAKYDYKAVFPAENKGRNKSGKLYDTPLDEAKAVYRNNLQRIDSVDSVIANLNYFNGCGFCTNDAAFMVGYAAAKGKQILGFVDAEHLSQPGCSVQDYMYCAPDERKVLGRSASRMVACAISVIIRGSIEDCLEVVFSDPQEEKTQEYFGPNNVEDL